MLSLESQNLLREEYKRLHPEWRPATEVFGELVRFHLRHDSCVLDLGCGRGGLVEQLDHPLEKVTGVDLDMQSLREHRSGLPRAAAYCEHLPFADNSFDLVFSSWLLEHLERPAPTFRAIGRVLRPSGSFVFLTPNGQHPLALLNKLFGRFARLQGYVVERLYGRASVDAFPTYYRANTLRSFNQLCQANGMRLIAFHAIADPTYLAFTPGLFRLARWLEAKIPTSWSLHLVGAMRYEPYGRRRHS
jgi:SAM-dependent methyltransferase